jgi:hypothetical protein
MSTTSTIPTRNVGAADSATGRFRLAARNGLTALTAGMVVIEIYRAIGRAAGIAMRAGAPGANTAQHLTAANFAFGICLGAVGGTLVAGLIARYTQRPRRTFLIAAVTLTAVSLVFPLAAAHAAPSTKLFLAGGHVLAATIMIPIFSRRLGRPARFTP